MIFHLWQRKLNWCFETSYPWSSCNEQIWLAKLMDLRSVLLCLNQMLPLMHIIASKDRWCFTNKRSSWDKNYDLQLYNLQNILHDLLEHISFINHSKYLEGAYSASTRLTLSVIHHSGMNSDTQAYPVKQDETKQRHIICNTILKKEKRSV